jgi:hypothetical protein
LEVLEDRTLPSTYLVDHLADDWGGSGLTGSLRYCINNAVDGDAINFGVTGTINLTWSLELTHNIGINGPGANLLTVRGPGVQRSYDFSVFTVPAGATVSISGLTITNGYSRFGGGIANAGTLTLSNSTVTGNYVSGCPTGDGCAWDDWIAAGAGIFNESGAILTINNSTISDNYGGLGGGIANGYDLRGTGDYSPGGTVTISNSTVSGNSGGYGGGIENAWEGSLTVINSTIVNNWSDSGGGIYNDSESMLNVTNSTIAGNAVHDYGGGIYSLGSKTVRNTIRALNTGDPATGTIDANYNLIGGDPLLGPLQDNGGPTQTMALLSGSPALNAGDPAQLGTADQRGVVRRGGVNIGAYQASASAFVVTAPATVTAGTPFDVTVMAVDPFGQTALGYTGTVTFSTTDPDPRVILPADYVFMAADQGTHTFSSGATLYTPGEQTLCATDTLDNTVTGSWTVTL